MDEQRAYILLNMMSGIGPVAVRSLSACLGSVSAILKADAASMIKAENVGPGLARKIVAQRTELDLDAELGRAEEIGARIITPIDAEYPEQLKKIHDPPLALYVRGRLMAGDKQAIAIVGTRRASHYGMGSAEKLAGQLARGGTTVISGLAGGIDTAAHRGALKSKGRTIAVLGSGLGHIYPPENRGLARDISGSGAVVSEFPIDRNPDKTTFPMRNRIVSGLSMGVLVVEAGVKSGALITANQAMSQGRSVFAVPGRIDSYASQGTNRLIKDGAGLVESADDVMQEFEFLFTPAAMRSTPAQAVSLSDDEASLVKLLEKGETGVDILIRQSGLSAAIVSSALMSLEMKRVVRMLPGRVVELA